MPGETLTLLSQREQLLVRYCLMLDFLPGDGRCQFERMIYWTDRKFDNPSIELLGLVGFDSKTQKFILIAFDCEEKNLTNAVELSQREQEVLQWVAAGCTNLQIARKLIISENTVKTHLQHIFAKLKVHSRTEAAMHAMQRGLLTT